MARNPAFRQPGRARSGSVAHRTRALRTLPAGDMAGLTPPVHGAADHNPGDTVGEACRHRHLPESNPAGHTLPVGGPRPVGRRRGLVRQGRTWTLAGFSQRYGRRAQCRYRRDCAVRAEPKPEAVSGSSGVLVCRGRRSESGSCKVTGRFGPQEGVQAAPARVWYLPGSEPSGGVSLPRIPFPCCACRWSNDAEQLCGDGEDDRGLKGEHPAQLGAQGFEVGFGGEIGPEPGFEGGEVGFRGGA